jgi:RND family efflux transporter MFP subunit
MFNRTRHRGVFLALLSVLGSVSCTRISAPDTARDVHSGTANVKRGNFRRTVRLNGTISAVESYSVHAPRLFGQMTGTGMMVITGIVRNGTTVRKGDILIEFDRQAQVKNILDRQAEVDGLVQQIRKKKADQASAKITDETEIKSAEVDVRTALVEMQKNDVIPKYQAEINKANLAEAEAQLQQLKETFTLKRSAEVADLRILEIQRDRAQRALEYAKSNVDRMTIRSPMDGMAVLTPTYKGTRMVDPQEGDEVRSGAAVMLVVNPSAMQVRASVNQVDVAKIHAGQSAEIRLDAYPDLVFPGKVERISARGTSSSNSKRIRHFFVQVSIQGKNPKLLPDLTASVNVELQNLDDVIIVPREAIITQKNQRMVEIVSNGAHERVPVKVGPMSDCEAVIENGLQEGMTVSLIPQEDAEEM